MKCRVYLRTLPIRAKGCPVPIMWQLKADPPPAVYHAVIGHRLVTYMPDQPKAEQLESPRRIQIVLFPAQHGEAPCDCPPCDPDESYHVDYQQALTWFLRQCGAVPARKVDEPDVWPKTDYLDDPLVYCPPAKIFVPHWRNLDLSPDDPEARQRGHEAVREWARQEREARLRLLDLRETTPVTIRYVGDRFRHVSVSP